MIIQHNMAAMNANRMYNLTVDKQKKSTEKLSSGYKINRAADDAAGLAISEKMRRQIRGLTQGVKNTEEGVSICQVADGALAEVSDILNRMEELSVKAANDTNTYDDRCYIQQEIDQLILEIDRIADTTTFNELPLFKGKDVMRMNADGTPYIESKIPFADFKMADLTLGTSPFGSRDKGNTLALQTIVDNPTSAANGKTYNLIFGNGSTSHPSVRLNYTTAAGSQKQTVNLANLSSENFSSGTGMDGKDYWTRDFHITTDDGVDMTITQKVSLAADSATDKNYAISYELKNDSAFDVETDFMFHVDTAYNNNDRCEGYFVNGSRVGKSCVYSEAGSKFTDGVTNPNIHAGVPDSFSIVDVDSALAFSEKIGFSGGKPDSLSIGYYNSVDDWPYYDALSSKLGSNAIGSDLGFSAMWNMNLTTGGSKQVGFQYGISAVDSDPNLSGVPITKSLKPIYDHYDVNDLWIQSGSEQWVGMYVKIDEMNTGILGIKDMDVTSQDNASRAITQNKEAQYKLMSNRSKIGAQQNRLEHTIANENNIIENTTAAESAIRDTDMATEMVQSSIQNVLAQAGISMLSQANQSGQAVLSLLG